MKRQEIYSKILNEEIAKIKPQATGITKGQISAAKARANKRFFKGGF